VVTIRGLSKAYGGRTVVDGLDLDVHDGEVLGLIGANGAGKTTTVECLQGLRSPDSGRLRVLGMNPVTQADALRLRIGSQLQDSSLPDRLRVGEAVELFARERPHRGPELLEQFGLTHKSRSPFAGLSGGERQRLFLVLALLNRPAIVILDELTQGLDPAARRTVWEAVSRLRKEGTTVLLVTHELAEAERLCSRVVAMRAGRVLDAGTPAELVERHGRTASMVFSVVDATGIEGLDRVPGVRNVQQSGRQVRLTGDRTMIAHVGAELVRRGTVPADLWVGVPDLEQALLALLDGADADGQQPAHPVGPSPDGRVAQQAASPAGATA